MKVQKVYVVSAAQSADLAAYYMPVSVHSTKEAAEAEVATLYYGGRVHKVTVK